MAMTEDERRKAKNEASRRWYQAHKAAKGAKNALPKAKTAEVRKAKNQAAPKLEKELGKFIEKGEKAAAAYRGLVKSAAEILGDTFKTGDEKLIAKACKAFGKKLNLEVKASPADGKAEISVSLGAKVFRIPKAKPAPERVSDEAEEPTEKIVPVDPSLLTGIENGSVSANDIAPSAADPDETEDEDDEDECDEEKDPDDMDDEEYKAYLERQADKEAEEWADGHADMMREMEEQGAYDGFEN